MTAPTPDQSPADRVRRFLDEYARPMPFAPDGFQPVGLLATLTRTGDSLLVSDLRAILDELAAARGRRRPHPQPKEQHMDPMMTIAPDANGVSVLWQVDLDPADGVTLTTPPIPILNLDQLPDHVATALERGYRHSRSFVPAHEIEGLDS